MTMLSKYLDPEHVWVAIGLIGQALFMMRFLVQWVASEKRRESIIPVAFWYFSIAGGLVLFAYSLYRADPVFIIGQSTGLFIYGRNLYLIHNQASAKEAAATDGARPVAQQ
jgi:lipid-A-disaccharide synthase-like uncharacterized protein